MKKVVIHKAGAYERLKVETAPDLTVGPGEVKVEVKAAGVNYADCMVRMGLYRSAKKFVGWPITPGFEVSGHVSAVGPGVQAFKAGDEVLAVTLFNGYASQVVVPERQVRRIPAGLDFAAAAGFPAVYLTAWYALCELAHPRPGSKVLVHSAAGGVGSSLVQIAKTLGCDVVGVVGASHKVEAAQGFGCDLVIDKSSEALWPAAERYAPDGYDTICDANGIATLGDSYAHLRRAGKLVVYGFTTMIPKVGGRPNYLKLARDFLRTPRFNPLNMTNEGKSVLAFNLSYLFDRPDFLAESMQQLVGWLQDGSVRAPPTTTYPLEAVAQAHRDIESAKTVGKLILTFD